MYNVLTYQWYRLSSNVYIEMTSNLIERLKPLGRTTIELMRAVCYKINEQLIPRKNIFRVKEDLRVYRVFRVFPGLLDQKDETEGLEMMLTVLPAHQVLKVKRETLVCQDKEDFQAKKVTIISLLLVTRLVVYTVSNVIHVFKLSTAGGFLKSLIMVLKHLSMTS